jgi:hypothetical protein
MKNFKKIAGINLLILFVYSLLLRLGGDAQGLTVVLGSCILIIFQVATNFIISLVCYAQSKSDLGNSYMLTAFIVAVIGFATCTMIH